MSSHPNELFGAAMRSQARIALHGWEARVELDAWLDGAVLRPGVVPHSWRITQDPAHFDAAVHQLAISLYVGSRDPVPLELGEFRHSVSHELVGEFLKAFVLFSSAMNRRRDYE